MKRCQFELFADMRRIPDQHFRMKQDRWLRIVPVALIMYTISYIDRTNVSLSLDPKISRMMQDLSMDDKMKGEAAGIFFFGYLLLQMPGGWLASRWSARKVISLCLICWGVCAIGCGLARTFRQFEVMRFFLGVAESAVFPATLVLLANWFPRARTRPGQRLLDAMPTAGRRRRPRRSPAGCWEPMAGGDAHPGRAAALLWLPVWWFCIRDHPREAKWISAEEQELSWKPRLQRNRRNWNRRSPSPCGRSFRDPLGLRA